MEFALQEPMVLVPLASFRDLGHIPRSNEADRIGVVEYEADVVNKGIRSESMIVFISHRWLSPSNDAKSAHPDRENAKYDIIVEGLERLLKGLDLKHVFVWIDFCCIDQDDPERKSRGVSSLSGYIERSDVLLTPYTEKFANGSAEISTGKMSADLRRDLGLFTKFKSLSEYVSRGWCRLEMFLASNCPLPEGGLQYFERLGISTRNDRPHLLFGDHQIPRGQLPEVAPRMTNSTLGQLRPVEGAVTSAEDLVKLKAITEMFEVDFNTVDSYEGETDAKGNPHGQGKMIYASGAVYDGKWVHGDWKGYGTYLFANGTLYKGDWKSKNVRHGKGTLYLSNGLVFSGSFKDGDTHGRGSLYYQNGNLKAAGMKVKTKWSGRFKEYYADGALRFDGNALNDKWDGKGKEFDEEGNLIREGTWKEGEFVREHKVQGATCMNCFRT